MVKEVKDIAVVYMVAGLSSRFKGKIKQFAMVTDRDTLIEYSVKQAIAAGFNKIIFIVGEMTELGFRERFGEVFQGVPVEYVKQEFDKAERDRPWGTADAVCEIRDVIKEPFVVVNGDDIYGEATFKILYDHLQSSDEEATIGYRLEKVIPEKGSVHRGVFHMDKNDYITDIVETFNIEKSRLAEMGLRQDALISMNIFALHPETIDMLSENLKKFKKKHKDDRKIEFLLPFEISNLIKEKKISMKVYPTEDRWFGVTNPGDENIVKEELKKLES